MKRKQVPGVAGGVGVLIHGLPVLVLYSFSMSVLAVKIKPGREKNIAEYAINSTSRRGQESETTGTCVFILRSKMGCMWMQLVEFIAGPRPLTASPPPIERLIGVELCTHE